MSATYAEPPTTTSDRGFEEIESPMAHLSPAQLDELGRELDALHAEIFADLGERDSRYIRSTIRLHRHLVLAARALLLGSSKRPLWFAGTAALSLAKILENMEIGHNVMHGQWDWMNDPDINSQILGLGHRLAGRRLAALPQLRAPHLHQHPRPRPRPGL